MKKTIALLLIFCLLLSSCARKSSENASAGDYVEDQVKRQITNLSATTPSAAVEGKEADRTLALSQWNFGLHLFHEISADEPGKNILISPYSLLSALAMTANGAAGETQSQMLEVLGGLTMEEQNLYWAKLGQERSEELKVANSIWFRDTESLQVHKDFLQTNADHYKAEIFKAPFNAETTEEINAWVEKNTNGMIPEIIKGIDASTMLYLINALAFEAEWSDTMRDAGDGRFEDRRVLTLAGDAEQWIETADAAGFLKNYKGGRYSFGALLPREGMDWDAFLQTLTAESVVQSLQNAQSAAVQIKMPAFSYDYDVTLRETLAELGMEKAFYSADFSPMAACAEGPLYIDQVIHKTYIEVDKFGTRAGAATGITMDTESAPLNTRQITLDRSFAYFILDNQSGLPLFIGALRQLEGEKLPPKETPETTWLNEEKTRGYRVEEGVCYITEDGGRSYRMGIHREEAAALAEQAAIDPKYQYQGWESVFEKSTMEPELLRLTEEKFPYWEPQWGSEDLPDSLVWAVRLTDRNDPLTHLYLYIDAYNGNVLGGGTLSD